MSSALPPHPRLLAHADVGTYGLAHSLLAWGRCRAWCNTHGVRMLAPNWLHVQHRIGPIRRRDRDKRQYHLLFQFPGYVTGARRAWALLTAERHVAEQTDPDTVLASGRPGLVVFRNRMSLNEETHFHEIHGQGPRLRQDLHAITKPRYRPAAFGAPHIALHVRMGDFSAPASLDALRQGAKNSRLPLTWYVQMLEGLRRRLGPVPARVFSDGSDADLEPLLRLPGVSRPPKQPSVSDLLGLADSRLVISSGSGFSMWGAFLADAPRLCFPGQRLARVLRPDAALELEPECEDVDTLPEAFWRHAGARFGA